MRKLAIFLLLSTSLFAAERQWQDATLVGITSDISGLLIASPIVTPTMTMAAPVRRTYYVFRTSDITYVLAFNPMNAWHAPNVTINKVTKIAVDGHNAHVLDDDGKDRRLPIVQKIARVQ